jgi:hypothetical protein
MSQPNPDPTQMTDAELTSAITAAGRAYIAARIARPQNPDTITAAKAWLDELVAEHDARA